MAYIPALDHIHNELSDIGGVVTDTLNGLRNDFCRLGASDGPRRPRIVF
ncbi:MAG: hypothetical protein QOC89_897 [Paraburkholderia sp.]|jgi:hypothetical protein|nr:hypothetical protein [Paraburkholderia sp.]MEA3131433.1 hypothetical protein [Paraburkholderia sp.]